MNYQKVSFFFCLSSTFGDYVQVEKLTFFEYYLVRRDEKVFDTTIRERMKAPGMDVKFQRDEGIVLMLIVGF